MISLISIENEDNPQLSSHKKYRKPSKANKNSTPLDNSHKEEESQHRLTPGSPAGQINLQSLTRLNKVAQSQRLIQQKEGGEVKGSSLFTPPKQQKNKKHFLKICSSNTNKATDPNQLTVPSILPQQSTSTLLPLSRVASEAERPNPLRQSTIVRASLNYFQAGQESKAKQQDPLFREQIQFKSSNTPKISLLIEEEQPFPLGNIELTNQIPNQQILPNNTKTENVQSKPRKLRLVSKFEAKLPLKQQFRYCIGCGQAVLQANIDYHSHSCAKYKAVFGEEMGSIVEHVKNKIASIKQQADGVIAKLDERDLERIREVSKKLMLNGQHYLQSQEEANLYLLEFDEVQKISANWFALFSLLQKMDWFLRLRKNLNNTYHL